MSEGPVRPCGATVQPLCRRTIPPNLHTFHPLSQEAEVAPVVADYWERAEFPFPLVPKLAKLCLGGGVLKGYGCPGQSVVGAAMAVIEMARVDASMSTFLMVHNSLAMLTIGERRGGGVGVCVGWLRG